MKPITAGFVLILVAACAAPAPGECTTGAAWTQGDEESPLMHPGADCVGCHQERGEGPTYTLAGTVMPTLDELDDCYGNEGVTVRITDANGAVTELVTNAAGNFFSTAAVATPFTAEVEADGAVRAMATAQSDGSCNTCHTPDGLQFAPGRILLPE